MEFLKPKKQEHWKLPALLNFFLGGMGASFYILIVLLSQFYGGYLAQLKSHYVILIAPVLVLIGFALLFFEAERPLKGYYLFYNLMHSFMSVEVVSGLIFIISTICLVFFSFIWLELLSFFSAIVLIVSQSLIIYRARSIPAWSLPVVPFLLIASSLKMGIGLILLLDVLNGSPVVQHKSVVVALLFTIMSLAFWVLYLKLCAKKTFCEVTDVLHKPLVNISVTYIGHLVPILLLITVLLFSTPAQEIIFLKYVLILIGFLILFGSFSQKITLLLGVDYVIGIAEIHTE